jgi:uncharacterized membrane protein
MNRFALTFEIDAPPERVWRVMRDVERWPEWTPTVTSVRPKKPGPFAVGSRYVIRQPKLPPALWQLTEIDDARRSFTWVTHSPGMVLHARHRVEETGERSRVTLSIEFSGFLGPLFARLTAKLNDRYLALEAKGLKARCEGAQTAAS